MDIWSGLFALGGVVLGAAFTEVHAWRDTRTRRAADLHTIRRQTYSTALRHVEAVASATARWAHGDIDHEPVWEAIATAYATENEVRLLAGATDAADLMHQVIRTYRDALTADERSLPVPRVARQELLSAFRRDLGIDPH